jgi:hypothetical protein
MKRLREYIKEQENKGSLTVFDIDDTLFHTTAQIAVVKDGVVLKKLTNQEYNTYTLKAGEKFDYSEFHDADKFYKESKPIGRMLAKAKAILTNSLRNPLSKVIIVTARSNFDNKEKFLQTFRKYGFDIDKVRVERAGNIGDIEVPAIKKYIIINNYIQDGTYGKVRLFDDSMANLKVFLKLKEKFPQIEFEAWFANSDGSVKRIK